MRNGLGFLAVGFLAVGLVGCSGADGKQGAQGAAGQPCTLTDNGDGTKTVACNGASVILANGAAGVDGTSCTIAGTGATKTITCTDGTSVDIQGGVDGASCTIAGTGAIKTITCGTTSADVTNGADGSNGLPGLPGVNGNSCTVVANANGSKTISCTDGTTAIVFDGTGAPVNLGAEAVTSLTATITSVTITANKPVVKFVVKDNFGRLATGLIGTMVRMGVAKLMPVDAVTGDPARWQSYITSVGSGPYTTTPCTVATETTDCAAVQYGNLAGSCDTSLFVCRARWSRTTTETGKTSNVVDNGDGTYTFSAATNLATIADAVDTAAVVGYEPTRLHRFALQISGTIGDIVIPYINTTYDMFPNGTVVTPAAKRNIVATASCNECHNKLVIHGSRYDVNYCVVCHNSGLHVSETDTLNLAVMVHGIHSAAKRTADAAAALLPVGALDYKIGNANFAEVTYPQGLNNCSKCHDSAIASTPQGAAWNTNPSIHACTGCHASPLLDFTDHPTSTSPNAAPVTNLDCAGCHTPSFIKRSHESENDSPHATMTPANAWNLAYDVSKVIVDDRTGVPTITFKISGVKAPGTTKAALNLVTLGTVAPELQWGPSFLLAYSRPALAPDTIVASCTSNTACVTAGFPFCVAGKCFAAPDMTPDSVVTSCLSSTDCVTPGYPSCIREIDTAVTSCSADTACVTAGFPTCLAGKCYATAAGQCYPKAARPVTDPVVTSCVVNGDCSVGYQNCIGGKCYPTNIANAGTDQQDYNNFGQKAAQPISVALNVLWPFNGDASAAACLANSACLGTVTAELDPKTGAATGAYIAAMKNVVKARFPLGASMRAVALQQYFTQTNLALAPSATPCTVASAKTDCVIDAGYTACDATALQCAWPTGRHTIAAFKAASSQSLPALADRARRSIVDSEKCANCHEWFEGHGGNRVKTVDVCVMCHNPSLSTSGKSTTSGAEVLPGALEAASLAAMTVRGMDPLAPMTWPEVSNNFKDMIHSVHASAARTNKFEFVRNRCSSTSTTGCVYFFDFSEVTFPGILTRCDTCHKPGTYDPTLPFSTTDGSTVDPTVVQTGSTATTPTEVLAKRMIVNNPDDILLSAVTTTCLDCHDNPLAHQHMLTYGAQELMLGVFGQRRDTPANFSAEECETCHGAGRLLDPAVVHR